MIKGQYRTHGQLKFNTLSTEYRARRLAGGGVQVVVGYHGLMQFVTQSTHTFDDGTLLGRLMQVKRANES